MSKCGYGKNRRMRVMRGPPLFQEDVMTKTRRDASVYEPFYNRARAILEALLSEMESRLHDGVVVDTTKWSTLFGEKQSMVVNLQKLVEVIDELSESEEKKPNPETSPQEGGKPLTDEELKLLSEWLADGKVINEGCAGHACG